MKTLEFKLQKRILIVETDSEITDTSIMVAGQYELDVNGRHIELICKGDELNEEIASKYVENFCADMNIPAYRNYAVKPEDLEDDHWAHVANDALDSFISAIEAKGVTWGNPLGDEPHNIGLIDTYPTGHPLMDDSLKVAKDWQEAESKTFHPDRVLISEIV